VPARREVARAGSRRKAQRTIGRPIQLEWNTRWVAAR